MKKYIDKVLNEANDYTKMLVKEYVELLKVSNLIEIISMRPGDVYYVAYYSGKQMSNLADLELDMLVDSY